MISDRNRVCSTHFVCVAASRSRDFSALKELLMHYLGERTIYSRNNMQIDVFAMTKLIQNIWRDFKYGEYKFWVLIIRLLEFEWWYRSISPSRTREKHWDWLKWCWFIPAGKFYVKALRFGERFSACDCRLSSDNVVLRTMFTRTNSGATITLKKIFETLLIKNLKQKEKAEEN